MVGAGGGVGHLAIQIAKAQGARVIGAASTHKHALLRELGVVEAIDSRGRDLADAVADVDVALDLTGGASLMQMLPTLRDGGQLISLTSRIDQVRRASRDRVRVTYMLVEPDRAGLEGIAALVDRGELRVHVARTFPLGQVAAAHAMLETERPPGKLVLTT